MMIVRKFFLGGVLLVHSVFAAEAHFGPDPGDFDPYDGDYGDDDDDEDGDPGIFRRQSSRDLSAIQEDDGDDGDDDPDILRRQSSGGESFKLMSLPKANESPRSAKTRRQRDIEWKEYEIRIAYSQIEYAADQPSKQYFQDKINKLEKELDELKGIKRDPEPRPKPPPLVRLDSLTKLDPDAKYDLIPGSTVTLKNMDDKCSALNGLKGRFVRRKSDGRCLVQINEDQDMDETAKQELKNQDREFRIPCGEDRVQRSYEAGDIVELCNFDVNKPGDRAFNGQMGTVLKPHPSTSDKWYVVIHQGEEFARLPDDFKSQSMRLNEKDEMQLTMSIKEKNFKRRKDPLR